MISKHTFKKQDRCQDHHTESFHDKTTKNQRQKENLKNKQREKLCYF